MKKSIATLAAAVLIIALMPATALAHGCGNGAARQQYYSLCEVENCHTAGIHQHDSTYYYGHSLGDGHDYHQLCDVQSCTLTGVHTHDDVTYFCHYNGDGHSYHTTNHHKAGRHH